MDTTTIRSVYRRMGPVYDPLFRRFYAGMRRESITALDLRADGRVVLVGAGSGLDLPLLPRVALALAVDLSPEMLSRAARANPGSAMTLADGARLPLRDGSVTAVVLHLVLSVAPVPRLLLDEAVRVLEPGGGIAILDHLAPVGRLAPWRRLLGRFPNLFGTHFDRRLEPLLAGSPLTVSVDRPFKRGMYRVLALRKAAATSCCE